MRAKRLKIHLLGPFKLGDGQEGNLPKKAQALLAYLAVNRGRWISRDQLADLLWAYSGPDQGRQSLRQCLTALRSELKDRVRIEANGADLRLAEPTGVEIDLHTFEQLTRSAAAEDLALASDLYRGDFLAGMEIASEPFSEWLTIERSRLFSAVCEILRRLAVVRGEIGDFDGAIASAQRLLALDPLREDGHRLLMQLYATAGRRGEAMRQFAECKDILRHALSIAPSEETTALSSRIRNDESRELSPASNHRAESAVLHLETTASTIGPASQPVPAWRRFVLRILKRLTHASLTGRRPLIGALLACSLVLTVGTSLLFVPQLSAPLAGIMDPSRSHTRDQDLRTPPATQLVAANTLEGRKRCDGWAARRGYSTDYIEARVGRRQPGIGQTWQGNINRDGVESGDVAIFDKWGGHVAYVEQVERDGTGRPVRILISDWNMPSLWLDAQCVVTEAFGKLNTFWVGVDQVSRYWRPNL